MFRGMLVLHHFGPPRQVCGVPFERKHTKRGEESGANARLQGLSFGPRRTIGQHVWHGWAQQKSVRSVQTAVVHQSRNMPKPQYRPLETHRNISRRGRFARDKEKFYRQWCTLRLAAPQEQRQESERCRDGIYQGVDTTSCKWTS